MKFGITNINTSSENSKLIDMDLLNKLSQCVQFVCYCITIRKILGLLVTASGTPPPTKVPRGGGQGGPGAGGVGSFTGCDLGGRSRLWGAAQFAGSSATGQCGALFAKASESREGDSRASNQALLCRGPGGGGGGGVHRQAPQGSASGAQKARAGA